MKDNKAITLIALIITIVIMLILVSIGIKIAINGELIGTTESAVNEWNDKVNDYKNKTDELLGKLDEEMEGNLESCSHSYGAWTIEKEATCTTKGSQKRTCNTCGDVQTQTIAATGIHSYGGWVTTTEPTCVSTGIRTKTCSNCGAVETEMLEELGHNWVNGVCSRCGLKCEHTYVDGTCTICNCECDHAFDVFTNGLCVISGGYFDEILAAHYHSCKSCGTTICGSDDGDFVYMSVICPLCSFDWALKLESPDGCSYFCCPSCKKVYVDTSTYNIVGETFDLNFVEE